MAGPLILFVPVLVFVMLSDLRWMRIPNWTSLAGVALFILAAPWLGWDEAVSRAIVAVAVFVLGFGLFAARILAGGDVKFLAALMLFIPSGSLFLFGMVFSASMLFATFLVVSARTSPMTDHSRWVGLRARAHMPMGVAMGLAGIVHLVLLLIAS